MNFLVESTEKAAEFRIGTTTCSSTTITLTNVVLLLVIIGRLNMSHFIKQVILEIVLKIRK